VIREFGLADIDIDVRTRHITSEMIQVQLDAVGDTIISLGAMQPSELDRVRDFVRDPANLMYGPLLIAAWGRKSA
jgi:hypothetical protein